MDSELRIRIKAIKDQRYFNKILEQVNAGLETFTTLDNSIYGPASFTNGYTTRHTK